MKQIGIWLVNGALAYTAMAGTMGATSSAVSQPGPVIRIEDVTRFYKVYDAAGGHPTVDQLQHDYLDPGSDRLHELTKLRHVTGAAIVEEIEARPEMYVSRPNSHDSPFRLNTYPTRSVATRRVPNP